MNILVFGAGFVGTTTAVTFAELGHNVTCVDTDEKKIESLQKGELYFCEPGLDTKLENYVAHSKIRFSIPTRQSVEENTIIFICVGTPSKSNGEANLTYIKQAAMTIGKYMDKYKLIVNKSTVPVGTCAKIQHWIEKSRRKEVQFDIASNPEFLREGNAIHDSFHPHRVVIGTDNPTAASLLVNLYENLNCPIMITNSDTAELIKYASNAFLATKISYINEMARLCDVLEINIRDVAKGMGYDPRIGPEFLAAGVGYGGSCFPKDVSALIKMAKQNGVTMSLLQQTQRVNETQSAYFLEKAGNRLGGWQGVTVAIFGIAFKPNTSDTRESPTLRIIPYLIDHGASIHAHDPVAMLPTSFQGAVTQFRTPEEAATGADVILLCTDWPQYYEEVNWAEIKTKMCKPFVFDGRGVLDARLMRELGFTYEGIGYS